MRNTRLIAVLLIALGLTLPVQRAFAADDMSKLSAEWWQWIFAIPASVNPNLDATGENCVIGQHGNVWFVAGAFGGTVTRTCSVPAGQVLFFPVINNSVFDSPGTCGQDDKSLTASQMRAAIAPFIDTATNLSVTLDNHRVRNMQRVKSVVFDVALPNENLYKVLLEIPCAAGIYSPAVDDGYYVMLEPLKAGPHTLNIHSENGAFVLDITYTLNVVPVTLH